MTIRNIKETDFDTVLHMMVDFYASDALLIHPPVETLRRTLGDCLAQTPYLEGFVFEEAGILAGYGMIAKSYSTEEGGICIWIEDIYILPDYRGKGFGTAFLQFIEQRFRGTAIRLRLEAEPENLPAMAVYRKTGFTVLGYTQMVKTLEK